MGFRKVTSESREPKLKAPPGACDTHIHFYNAKFPTAPSALMMPEDAWIDDYKDVQRHLSLERVVAVQPTAYGLDNSCQIEAMTAEHVRSLASGGLTNAAVVVLDNSECEILAMVGSANMDMRSLFLDYEVMQLSYTAPEIRDVEAWFENLATHCRTGVPQPGFAGQIAEGLVRMVAPLF